jgi:hypothetical protein
VTVLDYFTAACASCGNPVRGFTRDGRLGLVDHVDPADIQVGGTHMAFPADGSVVAVPFATYAKGEVAS